MSDTESDEDKMIDSNISMESVSDSDEESDTQLNFDDILAQDEEIIGIRN